MSEQNIKAWRKSAGLTLDAAAKIVGVTGAGARTTWRNWEIGKCSAPMEVISKVEALSEGRITFRDWLNARRAYKAARAEKAAA